MVCEECGYAVWRLLSSSFPCIAYKDRTGYNGFTSEKQNKTFVCSDNCILPTNEELKRFSLLLDELDRVSTNNIRIFIKNYTECTNFDQYNNNSDLDPSRVYMFPSHRRNHPEECYIPLRDKKYPFGHSICRSPETLIRKLMVHFENPRKLNNLIID